MLGPICHIEFMYLFVVIFSLLEVLFAVVLFVYFLT